ncbi:MAG TPA: PIN domain-containing protein [Phycisphaerae bacterium]|nr:PIN domain-containing protein [Phycisphaerae bacterium]
MLDTDILSEVLKGRNPAVLEKSAAYQAEHGVFCCSVISIVEIIAGLQQRQRTIQLEKFEDAISGLEVIPLDLEAATVAGRIQGDLDRTGQPIGKADPLIAGIAIYHDLTLTTGNTRHFERIRQLGYPIRLEDWRGEK